MKLSPRVHKHDFTEAATETAYAAIPLASSAECNRLLAAKTINFRVIMFMTPK